METFKQWILKKYHKEELAELAEHGASVGFPGLIYDKEIAKLYWKYQVEIWNMVSEDADKYKVKTLEFISTISKKEIACHRSFTNFLVWYAAKKIACEATCE